MQLVMKDIRGEGPRNRPTRSDRKRLAELWKIKMEEREMWKQYRRTGLSEMRPYVVGEDLTGTSVSDEDTPKEGDMIAREPKNHDDKWLVAKEYFDDNLELA